MVGRLTSRLYPPVAAFLPASSFSCRSPPRLAVMAVLSALNNAWQYASRNCTPCKRFTMDPMPPPSRNFALSLLLSRNIRKRERERDAYTLCNQFLHKRNDGFGIREGIFVLRRWGSRGISKWNPHPRSFLPCSVMFINLFESTLEFLGVPTMIHMAMIHPFHLEILKLPCWNSFSRRLAIVKPEIRFPR